MEAIPPTAPEKIEREYLLPGPTPQDDISEISFNNSAPPIHNLHYRQTLEGGRLPHPVYLPIPPSLPGTPTPEITGDLKDARLDSGFQSEGMPTSSPPQQKSPHSSPLRTDSYLIQADKAASDEMKELGDTTIALYASNPLFPENWSSTQTPISPPQTPFHGDLRQRFSLLRRIRSSSADLLESIRSSSVETHIKVSKNRRKWGFPTSLRRADPKSWKVRLAREADYLADLSTNPFYMPDGCGRHLFNLTVTGPITAVADTAINGLLLAATTTVLTAEAVASPAFLCCPCLSKHRNGFKEITLFTATTAKELTGELLDSACRIIPLVGAPISYLGKTSLEAASHCAKRCFWSIKSCFC